MNRTVKRRPVLSPLPMRGIRQVFTAGAMTAILLSTPAGDVVSAYGEAVLSAPGGRAERLEFVASADPSFSPSSGDWQAVDGSPTVVPVGEPDPASSRAPSLTVWVRNPSRATAVALDVTLGTAHVGARVTASAGEHVVRLPPGMPVRVIPALAPGAVERITVRLHCARRGESTAECPSLQLLLEGVAR